MSPSSLHSLLNSKQYICENCLKKLNPIFMEFKIEDVEGISIFYYDGFVKDEIFLYKGCEDYELKDIFVQPFKNELRLLFYDYLVVPIPSYIEDDEKRGYNHTIEIFKALNLAILPCIVKIKNVKQKELNYEERQKIGEVLKFDEKYCIKNKKILLVDDIVTTGASMKAAIKILKNNGAKKIKILCVAKRMLEKNEKFNHEKC